MASPKELSRSATRFCEDVAKYLDGAFAARAIDIAVSDEPNGMDCRIQGPDSVRLQRFAELDGGQASCFAIENEDVRFYRGGIDS